MNKRYLVEIAEELKINFCVLSALCHVESKGDGFLQDGKPKMLFEAHVFWQELQRYGINPHTIKGLGDILSPIWSRHLYAVGATPEARGQAEYQRLGRAIIIHKTAALRSASWGAFQIMGFNHTACGFAEVNDFVASQYNERGQLKAFANLLVSWNMKELINSLDWPKIAEKYNGLNYKKNGYDKKLQEAYEQCLNSPQNTEHP